MAQPKRTISFYRLVLQSRNGTNVSVLSNGEIEQCFNKIYSEKMRPVGNGRATTVSLGSGEYVLEVMRYCEHQVFAKLGHQNPADTVALRDRDTLCSEAVPMTTNQLLEVFTYFIIDFTTGIISYIGIGGTPRISVIRGMFETYLAAENIEARIASVMTSDIISVLARKKIISKIEVAFAIPSDEDLSNKMGLSLSSFDSLRNVKARNVTFSLVANRNKNIFAQSSELAVWFENLCEQVGSRITGVRVNAKDEDETSQPYDLLNYCFTKKVTLGTTPYTPLTEEDYYTGLWKTYLSNKTELLRYTGQR